LRKSYLKSLNPNLSEEEINKLIPEWKLKRNL